MDIRYMHSLSEVLASRYCCFRIAQVCREVSCLTDPFSCAQDIGLRAVIFPCHAALWESNTIPAQAPPVSPQSSWARGHHLCQRVWFCIWHAEESMSDHFCSLHQWQLQMLGGHKVIQEQQHLQELWSSTKHGWAFAFRDRCCVGLEDMYRDVVQRGRA